MAKAGKSPVNGTGVLFVPLQPTTEAVGYGKGKRSRKSASFHTPSEDAGNGKQNERVFSHTLWMVGLRKKENLEANLQASRGFLQWSLMSLDRDRA